MRIDFLAWPALAALTLACSTAVSEPTPRRDDHVAQADAVGFCDAFAIVQEKCVRCHSDPPQHGAPFALDSYEATQVPIRDGKAIRADRMHEVIDSGFMPLTSLRLDPPVQALSCDERETILQWIDQGAEPPPDDDPDCEAAKPALRSCDAEP
jgi:uncharacterized membrane protein